MGQAWANSIQLVIGQHMPFPTFLDVGGSYLAKSEPCTAYLHTHAYIAISFPKENELVFPSKSTV